MIRLNDLSFETFISEEAINDAIDKLAVQINTDYAGKTPVFIVVLNGAFRFASEIISRFTGDCRVEFVKMSSYDGTESTGDVLTHMTLDFELEDEEVIIVEDIVDSGNTIEKLVNMIAGGSIANYSIATLFFKPEAYTKEYKIHYPGLEIPNDFIVGYGLDYNGLGRNLNAIYKLKKTD
ncbi:MAG: phosphoribosyltransferase family protein [Leeuwenhoekiella sp.]